MESIYYVLTWLCHRKCVHCYDDRFRPYYGGELQAVIEESRANFPRVIENLPARMTYLDRQDHMREKRGRIILAGGEILLEPVRESVLYPALRMIEEKYRGVGGVDRIIQTTGDVLNARIVDELLEFGVHMISVSGLDAFHQGLESGQTREALQQKLVRLFESRGMRAYEIALPVRHGAAASDEERTTPLYSFFGANPGTWIGKIWPRGRAFENGLSTADIEDNFCANWSGGIHFLEHRYNGSEVSIEPNGNVYPCCIKTRLPVGNLLEEPLDQILERHASNPVYQAISAGEPQRMGLSQGWTVEHFRKKSETRLPDGRLYRNLCVGCDAFHQEVLLRSSDLVNITSASRA
jgi:MoaA/NifB/PqqE/SkfB family radical SAM enzyme